MQKKMEVLSVQNSNQSNKQVQRNQRDKLKFHCTMPREKTRCAVFHAHPDEVSRNRVSSDEVLSCILFFEAFCCFVF